MTNNQYIGDTNNLYNFNPVEAQREFTKVTKVINSLKIRGEY